MEVGEVVARANLHSPPLPILMITKISYWLAIAFYSPSILIAKLYNYIAYKLLKSSYESYGMPAGYRSKLALKLRTRAYKIVDEVAVDAIAYAAQIKEKETIMKAIRADHPYDLVPKEDKKKPKKEQTIFKVKFIDPYMAAKLGDQMFDVKGAGSSRKERLLTGTQALEILKDCLVGWENLEHPDSTEENKKLVEFDKKDIDGMIEMVHPKTRSEIVDFARGESELDEGEE
ncbi:MAG: hypothetical protein ACTSW7_01210 [Candidatus Thorarchaeota archaeon]|nr:hypothetical protein [Thermoplasmatales archaeon]